MGSTSGACRVGSASGGVANGDRRREDASPPLSAALVVVGDELLDGYVYDTNLFYACRALRVAGVRVAEARFVRDDVEAIASTVSELVDSTELGVDVLITSGGLGPTPDDVTCQGVAYSLGRELEERRALIQNAIANGRSEAPSVGAAQDRASKKLGTVPEGSRILGDASGWNWVACVDIEGGIERDGSSVILLPGVPEYFRTLLDEIVLPHLADMSPGAQFSTEEISHHLSEVEIADVLDELNREYPHVAVGSYPGDPCIIRLRGARDEVRDAAVLMQQRLSGRRMD